MDNISYSLTQSFRRSIAIHINRDGDVLVRAPKWVSRKRIHDFVLSKRGWITKKKSEVHTFNTIEPQVSFCEGTYFLYLGSYHPLRISSLPTRRKLSLGTGEFVLSPDTVNSAEDRFRKWYREAALLYFEIRVQQLAHRYSLKYKEVKLSNAKTSWGACTSKQTIRLNWRLMMAPLPIIDYVIIHELAHTIRMDHSPKFWKLVSEMCPDWALRRKWLNQWGRYLVIGGISKPPENLRIGPDYCWENVD